ncbi:MAG: hypothetical protein QF473_31225 [Planctomycetota bacterium]|nr:hypothetical protein [Planctomycetota bacterium]
MTPRKRVETALSGGHTDRVPFTIYEGMIPQCTAEREMRNRGLCIVNRRAPVVRTHRPNVKVSQHTSTENGKRLTRTTYVTPAGTLSTLDEPAGFTSWHHEKMFKSPEDYKALLSFIKDEQHEPCYDVFARAQESFGEDAIFRVSFGLEPLQTLISGNMIGMEEFCIQWMDNRDEILKLYEAIVENRRKLYPLIAESPALHANYGGNVVPEITGPEIFREYFLPHYNEAAEYMHRHGKLIGCHFDDDCGLLAEAIAETDLDYIEAFTPAPTTDMTVAEARKAWPDKVLWLNFPCDAHLKPPKAIAEVAMDLADQAETPDGFLIGITDDVPEDRWQRNCLSIMDGLDQHARLHPELYS